ncbi:VAN3-binding protein-like [Zingiber officinale]|uniref:Uncharacterized protein n=1 Tax=Zingiber officinale TaxID=94328 RepID=A0A8J5G3N6_ZINOF|nr:VAN3-binding protein-like [Zingiber officinale]KAG6497782.1 hypothetical protein ZIOFF_045688 [Zingiber officinale]
MDFKINTARPDASLDILSDAWCNSAIQVFQPTVDECSNLFKDKQIVASESYKMALTSKGERNLKVDEGEFKATSQIKIDDLKSWIWLQKAIHPELDYDLCTRQKWFTKIGAWNGKSIKKWLKEIKQKRKDQKRLHEAEIHAAISVAGVAAALAVIAAEESEANKHKSLKESAVASAAALVAAQCAQVAEAVGAKHDEISSAINQAVTARDASNIITLTAATATSLRGVTTLRRRQNHTEKLKGSPLKLLDEFDFDFGRCRTLLAKGDEIHVATPDGKCRIKSVSVILNKDAKVLLKIKKINMLMVLSTAKECFISELRTNPLGDPVQDQDDSYSIEMTTSQGKIELKFDDYIRFKKWITTINHMLMLSVTFSKQGGVPLP